AAAGDRREGRRRGIPRGEGARVVEHAGGGDGAQTRGDAAEGRDVGVLRVLLPPVVAGSAPRRDEVVDRRRKRVAPPVERQSVALRVSDGGPHPQAVTVELE